MERREGLSSRLGFILVSAACAIGLGNVWRFPYVAGKFGGGLFVAVYLACLALVGVPILAMEFAAGRASRRSIVRLHRELTPGKPAWSAHGVLGFAGMLGLLMFYTTVTGWMLIYAVRVLRGAFVGLTPQEVESVFGSLLQSPGAMAGAMAAVSVGSVAVVALGLQRGVERVTKVMMFSLFLLIIALVVRCLTLDSAGEGVRYYLVPDFSCVRKHGLAAIVCEAMNHAFFTLSLGIGSMSVFGSYIGRDRALAGEAAVVAVLDTVVAILSGLIVIPACFAFGIEPGQGPSLVFVTLPNVFNQMAGGRFWGATFFMLLFAAAITTVITIAESLLACIVDATGKSRRFASVLLAVALLVLSLPCVFGFNVWKAFRPFGEGSSVLDLEDFVVSTVLLPVGGLMFVLYCTHRFGWGWKEFLDEVNRGRGLRFPTGARFYCAYVLPLLVLTIFVMGLVAKFGG